MTMTMDENRKRSPEWLAAEANVAAILGARTDEEREAASAERWAATVARNEARLAAAAADGG